MDIEGTFKNANSKKGTNFAIYYASSSGGVQGSSPSDLRLTITPNPATDAVTVKLPTQSNSLIIADALGRIIKQLGTNQLRGESTTIDIHDLHSGAYTVSCSSESGAYHSNFIVTH